MDISFFIITLVLWSPALISGAAFIHSYLREPRQFRNGIYLLIFLLWAALMILMRYGQEWMVVPLVLACMLVPLVSIVALLANAVVGIKKSGVSAVSLLPAAMAGLILFMLAALPVALAARAPAWLADVIMLANAEALWFCFTLVGFLLYSWLYRRLPRRRTYDYIVIHGAGLVGDQPSPLLAGRIDKGLELWARQGKKGIFVPSGGQGADEVVSEAAAMTSYLLAHGVSEQQILPESRSTTTLENLRFSKELMDEHARGQAYRCVVVTSDFHVFRCAEYAHTLDMAADGVGSKTAGWYWPQAALREFAAITKAHMTPYVVIAILWALPLVFEAIHWVFTLVKGVGE